MTVAERLTRCKLIEKMQKNEAYARKLGISNDSKFCERSNSYDEIKR